MHVLLLLIYIYILSRHRSGRSGVIGNLASRGIWHPRVKFPREYGIPPGNLASLRMPNSPAYPLIKIRYKRQHTGQYHFI